MLVARYQNSRNGIDQSRNRYVVFSKKSKTRREVPKDHNKKFRHILLKEQRFFWF
jgi:hypothetical protein